MTTEPLIERPLKPGRKRYVSQGGPMVEVAPPPPPPPPIEPPPPRSWPYSPDAKTLTAWVNTAIWHNIAIRATGSVPNPGGPSVPIQLSPLATEAGIQDAAQRAEAFWPQARQFDVIGSDLEYLAKVDTEVLEAGMNRLRDAVTITTFRVIDRPPVIPPAQPAAEPQ